MQRRCSGQQTFANDLGKDHFEFLRTTSMAADHAFRIPMSSNSAETARRTKYACLVEVTPSQADSCSAATYVRFGPKADIDHASHVILEQKKRPPGGGLFEQS